MSYEPKPNTGSLFTNDRKTTDKHPDRSGNVVVVCPGCGVTTNYWLNGWLKDGARGQFLSLSLKRKEPAARPAQQQQEPQDGPPPF